jgi:hypothetical protein
MDADIAAALFSFHQQRFKYHLLDVAPHDAPLAAELRAGAVVDENGVLHALVRNTIAQSLADGGDRVSDSGQVLVACLENNMQTLARAAASSAAACLIGTIGTAGETGRVVPGHGRMVLLGTGASAYVPHLECAAPVTEQQPLSDVHQHPALDCSALLSCGT